MILKDQDYPYLTRWLKWRLRKALATDDESRVEEVLSSWLAIVTLLRSFFSFVIPSRQKAKHEAQYRDIKKFQHELTREKNNREHAQKIQQRQTQHEHNIPDTSGAEPLGKGRFADVVLTDGVAVKKIKLRNVVSAGDKIIPRQQYQMEVDILKACKGHPNIIPLLSYDKPNTGRTAYIVIQAAELNLADWLIPNKHDEKFSPIRDTQRTLQLNAIFMGVAEGINYLHQKGFVHRDIKAPNVVITLNQTAKLIDFGLACRKQDFNHEKPVGTPLYLAPEHFDPVNAQNVTPEKTDIYGFGILMLEAVTGQEVFAKAQDISALGEAKRKQTVPTLLSAVTAQNACQRLIEGCVQKSPSDRFNNAEMLDGVRQLDTTQAQRDQRVQKILKILPQGLSTKSHIGKGAFGQVYRHDGVAIKCISYGSEQQGKKKNSTMITDQYKKEVAVLKACRNHPNIIEIFDQKTAYDVYPYFTHSIVMEAGERTLWDWLDPINFKNMGKIPYLQQLNTFFVGVAEGIGYLHQQGYIHRDIKPTNVVLSITNTPKLIDFGLAKTHQEVNIKKMAGTSYYMAPEYFIENPGVINPEKIDVYSFGLLMLACYTKQTPFKKNGRCKDGLVAVKRNLNKPDTPTMDALPKNVRVLIEHCIFKKIEQRYDDQQMLDGVKKLDTQKTTVSTSPKIE